MARLLRLAASFLLLWGLLEAGQALASILPVTLPGSVVGMVLLLALLELGVVRLAWVEPSGDLLLAWLGLLFVPAGLGVLDVEGSVGEWLGLGSIILVGGLVTIGLVGVLVQRGVVRDLERG
ncbi:CidA/LrgA family protein [Conexibacter sp. SYSU D00693]|uniref:CidA/LrgA family protein n=1 Tax=Conexibacter sp. SYSU D00693 TaxID=2812560 RepID=UPI00196A7422|nr:CidA/LrgA family protein [Conexibacter sp. SYSU D00693]